MIPRAWSRREVVTTYPEVWWPEVTTTDIFQVLLLDSGEKPASSLNFRATVPALSIPHGLLGGIIEVFRFFLGFIHLFIIDYSFIHNRLFIYLLWYLLIFGFPIVYNKCLYGIYGNVRYIALRYQSKMATPLHWPWFSNSPSPPKPRPSLYALGFRRCSHTTTIWGWWCTNFIASL